MAITVDWPNKIIQVPRADMTLIQVSPEIRQLDLNVFRLTLKDLEDSDEGMPYLDTHRHNTEVTVGGMTLARVIEIINGYTVTFEDGQYAVNLVGANSNVMDATNVNSVSIRSSNSAGMVVGGSGGGVSPETEATIAKLESTMEQDGAVFRFTQNALEQAPTGGGGTGSGEGGLSPAQVTVVARR